MTAASVREHSAPDRAGASTWFYLLIGASVLVAYSLVTTPATSIFYLVASAMPVVALPLGILLRRPRRALPWLLIAAGQGSYFLGDVVWHGAVLSGTQPGFPSAADGLYLLGYPLMAAGMLAFIRERRSAIRLAPIIDATAVGIGTAVLLWVAGAAAAPGTRGLGETLLALAYPVGDAMLLGSATYLLLSTQRRPAALYALVASLVALLLADAGYSVMLAATGYEAGLFDLLWLGSYVLVGLSGLLPSMREMTEPDPGGVAHDRRHLVVVGVAIVVAGVPLFEVAVGQPIQPEVVLVAEIALVALLFVRVRQLLSETAEHDRRFAALLAHASDAFAVLEADGTVRYASPASGRLLSTSPDQYIGRAVDSMVGLVHPDDRARSERLNAIFATPGGVMSEEFRIADGNGEYRWLSVVAYNRMDEPLVEGIVFNFHDVTERVESDAELRFRAEILENVHDAIVVANLDGKLIHWNEGAAKIFGYTAEEAIGMPFSAMYPPGVDLQSEDIAAILEGAESLGEREFRRKDGSRGWAEAHTSVMRDAAGKPVGLIGVLSDVSRQRNADALLARLGTAVEQSSESIMITNASAEIEYVNQAFERVTGYSREEVLGRNPRFLQSGAQPRSFYEAMWATLTAGRPWVADFVNRRKDGTLMEETGVTTPLVDDAGLITGYLSVRRDVTDERRLEEQSHRLARERALVAETIRRIDARDSPEATAQAICRQVASLTQVATAGLFVFELDGRAAPYGFVIGGEPKPLVRRVPLERSRWLHDQARRGPWIQVWVEQPAHPYNSIFMRLGVKSIAYAPVRDRGEVIGFLHISSASPEAEEVLTSALPALVEFAEIAGTLIGHRIAERTEIATARARIRQIIAQRAFSTVYQPIVDLRTDRVVGYEALTRFDDRAAPDVRFGEAEAVGLGMQLEMVALAEAIASADQLPEGTWLNVNASPDLMLDPRRLERLLRRTDRPIVIEVTEHAEVADYAAFRAARESMVGDVRIAIDDAGAGFASLRHVLELQPSFVKLDRSLIESIDVDQARAALVSGMAHFAASTGAILIAEGIQSAEELAAVRRLGVTLGQGYLLGRPQPAAAFAQRAIILPVA